MLDFAKRRLWLFSAICAAAFCCLAGGYTAYRISNDYVGRQLAVLLWIDLWETPAQSGLMLGSSTMKRIDPDADLRCGVWVNRGVGAATIRDVIFYLNWNWAAHTPKRVAIYVGDNDIAFGMSLEQTIADYQELIALLRSTYGDVQIFALPIKFSPKRAGVHAVFSEFNSWLEAMSQTDPKITYIGSKLTGAEAGRIEGAFDPDGIHLSPSGYRIFLAPFRAVCAADA